MTVPVNWRAILVVSGSLLLAVPAFAQDQIADQSGQGCPGGEVANAPFQGFNGVPYPPCAEPSLPPSKVKPLNSRKPAEFAEPAGPPLEADTHLSETDLGFQQGVAPAPGRSVTWHGQKYRVVDVTAAGGGPTFAGGSPFVIGVAGSKLTVGLKAIDPGSLLDPDRLEVSAVN